MASDQISRLLSSESKEVEKATGVLARLARRILAEKNINHWKWGQLMDAYLNNPRNGIPNNTRDQSSARGNFNKEVNRPTMTWRVFDKFLRFLGATHVRFEVHITMPNKKTTVHGINIRLNDEPMESVPGEDEEDEDSPAD